MSISLLKQALSKGDVKALSQIPKSDLHSHSMLGSRIEVLEKFVGRKLQPPPYRMESFQVFEGYLSESFRPLIPQEGFFSHMLSAAFQQAVDDGIKVLQMSIDSRFYYTFPRREKDIVEVVERVRRETAPELHFIPQLGMDRTCDFTKLSSEVSALLDTGYFRSIDLYGDESYGDIHDFVPIFKRAKQMNLVLCAHAGEYGTAESVRGAIELLELTQVQHGIGAASSPEIMRWIAENHVVLNVCPSSNVALCRAESIKKHPMRILFDHGIKVTINTDDLLVFGQSVSEEYLNLYKEDVFSADELETIRQNGLSVAP